MNVEERFGEYRTFSGFAHITELVTLDSIMCPDVISELRSEDWKFNIHEAFRTGLFARGYFETLPTYYHVNRLMRQSTN